MVAQAEQSAGQNPAYRPSDTAPDDNGQRLAMAGIAPARGCLALNIFCTGRIDARNDLQRKSLYGLNHLAGRLMADTRDETVIIPIAHEELFTSTREIETGRVRVKTVIDEHEEIVRQELARSTVDVERVTIDREVDEIPAPRMEGDVYIIPVVKEVLFVRKALVLTEEVRLHRKTFTEQVEQPVTVRSQRAVVEREGSAGLSDRQSPKE